MLPHPFLPLHAFFLFCCFSLCVTQVLGIMGGDSDSPAARPLTTLNRNEDQTLVVTYCFEPRLLPAGMSATTFPPHQLDQPSLKLRCLCEDRWLNTFGNAVNDLTIQTAVTKLSGKSRVQTVQAPPHERMWTAGWLTQVEFIRPHSSWFHQDYASRLTPESPPVCCCQTWAVN